MRISFSYTTNLSHFSPINISLSSSCQYNVTIWLVGVNFTLLSLSKYCLFQISVGVCDLLLIFFLYKTLSPHGVNNFFLFSYSSFLLSPTSSSLPLCSFVCLLFCVPVTNSSLISPPAASISSQYFQMHQRLDRLSPFLGTFLPCIPRPLALLYTGHSLKSLPRRLASLDRLLHDLGVPLACPGPDRFFSGLHVFLFLGYSLSMWWSTFSRRFLRRLQGGKCLKIFCMPENVLKFYYHIWLIVCLV